MNIEIRRKFLMEQIEDCQTGIYRWDDAAWSFIVNITDSNDSSLFTLATPEIKAEILRRIEMLHTDGQYTAYLAGVGAIDSTGVIKNLESLLISGGFIPQTRNQ